MGNVTCVLNIIINHAIYINNLYSFKPVCFFLHSAGLSHATDGGVSSVASLPQSCSSPPGVILYPKFCVIYPGCCIELQTKVREDFTVMEKPTRAFFWLKSPTSALFKALLRHYAKQTLTDGS